MTHRPSSELPTIGPSAWKQRARSAVYLLIVLLLAAFLFHLGREPWVLAAGHWPVLVAVMISIGAGLIVQAKSFQAVAPTATCDLPVPTLVHIWAVSAVLSVVAPLFAGLATRTALLMRSGMPLSACLTTSTRQIWMGLEFALLLAAGSLPFVGLPNSHLFAAGAAAGWILMLTVRLTTAKGAPSHRFSSARMRRLLYTIGHRIPPHAYPWFFLQVALMGATYYIGFNGLGAQLSWAEAITLAALTVVLSLIVLVPNGLGFSDAVWVYVAMQAGLSLEGSVALAILLRMAHFLSSLLISFSLYLAIGKVTFRQ